MNKKIVICFSGGLDSHIMYHLAKKRGYTDITKVFFDIGQPYFHKEVQALKYDDVDIRRIEWLGKDQELGSKEGSKSGNIIIPGRNAVLATTAASIYLPDEIWMGGLLGEMHAKSTDKNWDFIEKINSMLSYVHQFEERIPQVAFPLADEGWGKFEATQWAYQNGMTEQELMDTSSCLSGEIGKCGKCVVCLRRWGIFGQIGFSEEYNVDPLTVESNKEIIREMLRYETEGKSHYDEYRRREILPHVKWHLCENEPNKVLNKLDHL